MKQITREEQCRVVFGFNGKRASPPVIHDQITSLESAWFAKGVENTGNEPAPISAAVGIRVPAEVRPIIVSVHI
jgi:hypothetical protein